MKKLFLWIFIMTLFCSWAIAEDSDTPKELILFEECPIGYPMFGQIPTTFFDYNPNIYGSDIGWGRRFFDNFWELSEDICKITWWGVTLYFNPYLRECTENPMDFEVALYPDDGSGKPDTLNPIYTLPSVTLTGTPTAQMYGPYGDPDNEFWIELIRYELDMDPCVAATEGWISVMGISYGGDPEDCWFCWQNSLQGDGISWRFLDQGWEQMEDDAAFCLGGQYTPIYGACCDPSTGDCLDNVDYQDCPQGARFVVNTLCEDIDPPCRLIIFCESFDGSLGSFTSYEAGDPAGWHWDVFQGNPRGSAFHNDDEVDCDDWLISPGDYTVAAGDILEWDQASAWADYYYYHGVLISSDYVAGSDPTTATWTELYAGAPEDAWETQSVDLSAFAGETVHIAFHYTGNWADEWWVDNACVYGTVAPPCVYTPGDSDEDGTARQLTDVVKMIAYYRGFDQPVYDCNCPEENPEYKPSADADGNCTSFELTDVVKSIAAYRGPEPLSGCPDCPGTGRLALGQGGTPVAPSLKSKIKINKGKTAE